MKRRQFLASSLAAGATLWIADQSSAAAAESKPVPRRGGSTMGFLSKEQMTYHYGKHHAAYFAKLNGLLEGKPEASLSLREVVVQSSGPVFNNAAQAWNHTFFWNCMMPKGGGSPKGKLAAAIDRDFGSLKDFQKKFSEVSVGVFGSGWGWLATDKAGKLEIMPGSNADLPLKHGKEPVLTVDVWEHAYYVDYRNERPRFVEGFWNAVNWDFAAKCYEDATK
jgi:superoxide dismutase, Fe-Mn family